ncbi:CotH kinase family protein [Anatilimnocola floriformis]|uniref:CotH kinase family protein n=1 Tax=Anatilimnocola floriformis TaxID=2948575 RepID=UPI0020C20AF6|nr:CotH kinase family protein [Anatilimnocola floriformis]
MIRSLVLAISAGLVFASSATAGTPPPYSPPTHRPQQPKGGESVQISFDAPFVVFKSAVLQLQAVPPGEYIRKTDPDFKKKWVELPMKGGLALPSATASSFGFQIPAEQIKHRWLYRYRVVVTKSNDEKLVLPSEEGNYAFFCYDGVPAWSGSREPGKSPERKFTSEFLNTIKPYHLIARGQDIATSQWDGGAYKKRFPATFVYEGQVYDHMEFSNRGQGSAYISGKNKWALKFPKAEPQRAEWKDLPTALPSRNDIDLNPGQSTPYLPVLRGVAGLDEALTFRAFQLAGVPSSSTHWVHFRVIDSATESNPKDQYDGDLWGLYLAVTDLDQHLLKQQNLPDGLIVSIQSGIKHLPDDKSAGQKEWDTFRSGMQPGQKEDWWRTNLDLPKYYSFHALNRLIGNVDIRPDGNHGYYRAPNGQWSPIPWDNDMCFVPRHHQPGHIDAIRCLDVPRIKREYQNRAREILDLFVADASPSGGQIGQLISELARVISPAGFETNWAQLDEAAWNWRPQFNQKGSYFVNPAQGNHFGGGWERKLATNDIKGFEKYLLDFCTDSRPVKNYAPNDGNPQGYGWGYVAYEAMDKDIPPKPVVKRTDSDSQFRTFEVDKRTWPEGKRPALEWRVARVAAPGVEGWTKGDPYLYELTDLWRSRANDRRLEDRMILSQKLFAQRGTYRVRARYHDAEGRAGNWSEPAIEIVK